MLPCQPPRRKSTRSFPCPSSCRCCRPLPSTAARTAAASRARANRAPRTYRALSKRAAVFPEVAGDQRGDGAALDRLRQKIVRIEAFPFQRDKEFARRNGPAIGADALETHTGIADDARVWNQRRRFAQ